MSMNKQFLVAALVALTSLSAHAGEGCLNGAQKDAKRVAVEGFVANLTKGDMAAATSVLTPDAVLFAHDETGPLGGKWPGREGVASFYTKHMTYIQITALSATDWVCQNNRLVVFWDEAGYAISTGKSFHTAIVQSWTFNDAGKATNEEIFWDSALTAATFVPNP